MQLVTEGPPGKFKLKDGAHVKETDFVINTLLEGSLSWCARCVQDRMKKACQENLAVCVLLKMFVCVFVCVCECFIAAD